MNLRTLKRMKQTQMGLLFADLFAGRRIVAREAAKKLAHNMALAELVEGLPDIAPEFRCVKVKGGEVVDTFQTRSEALALVLKHAKQRKAKLQVLNTSTGELELFSEEELA